MLGIPSAYGTSPYRPFWVGALVIVVFWIAYWRRDPFVSKGDKVEIPKRPVPVFALLYSIDTFVPLVSITGVKNWGWTIASEDRWLELVERLLGLFIGGFAAYSVASYVL